MSTKNIKEMSTQELAALDRRINEERAKRRKEEIAKQVEDVKNYAVSKGYDINEIFGGRKTEPSVKYRHPDDPTKVWSGRGRRPDWLNTICGQGVNLDDLKVY